MSIVSLCVKTDTQAGVVKSSAAEPAIDRAASVSSSDSAKPDEVLLLILKGRNTYRHHRFLT